MYYVQFLQNSTGYISGTIPPQFSHEHVKPIPLCGSDGGYKPDGRLSMWRVVIEARIRAKNKQNCTGFEVQQLNGYASPNVLHREIL